MVWEVQSDSRRLASATLTLLQHLTLFSLNQRPAGALQSLLFDFRAEPHSLNLVFRLVWSHR